MLTLAEPEFAPVAALEGCLLFHSAHLLEASLPLFMTVLFILSPNPGSSLPPASLNSQLRALNCIRAFSAVHIPRYDPGSYCWRITAERLLSWSQAQHTWNRGENSQLRRRTCLAQDGEGVGIFSHRKAYFVPQGGIFVLEAPFDSSHPDNTLGGRH